MAEKRCIPSATACRQRRASHVGYGARGGYREQIGEQPVRGVGSRVSEPRQLRSVIERILVTLRRRHRRDERLGDAWLSEGTGPA